ncbi:hypothetical protein [Luteimonas sp. FCS-9]|uniref:hypothetical protein n=1 Tax=Luteimonas sp. FCS-9 TaxID=1547516 RepID=UPI00063E80B8|nr:hypothetical protein [Luteimonas sp. FCS-9]KLI98722.1 hypothetical protein WQ56_14415 [Luteimonas sp. FCS-9]
MDVDLPTPGESAQDDGFTQDERALLRDHGIVLFAGRVIFDAQPPIDDDTLRAVDACCRGGVPAPLAALWRLTAGGRLDYDLVLPMDGHEEAISWTELFFRGSDGYRDLDGWIEHERELAQDDADEDGRDWDGLLDVLPFGGFEYCDRLYIVTDPAAPDHGHVLAWKQGLPPAWTHARHEDGLATVGEHLHAAFRALVLERDPQAPDADTGTELLDYPDTRCAEHGLDDALAARVADFHRRALLDWRGALAGRGLAAQPALAWLALCTAIEADDPALLAQVADAGAALDVPLRGSAGAIDLALVHGAHAALAMLLDRGAPVGPRALDQVNGALPPALAARLLAVPGQATVEAVLACVVQGASDSAALVAAQLPAADRATLPARFAAARASLVADLDKVRSGRLGHFLGEAGLQQRIDRLDAWRAG